MKRYAGERLDDGSVRVIVCDDALYGEAFARWTVLAPVLPPVLPPIVPTVTTVATSPALVATSPALRLLSCGFDWGLEGEGGVKLSRAILTDCLGPDLAEHLYQDFEWSVIRGLPLDAWELDEEIIRGVVEIQPILRDARTALTAA